jgi:hypothetical protein
VVKGGTTIRLTSSNNSDSNFYGLAKAERTNFYRKTKRRDAKA